MLKAFMGCVSGRPGRCHSVPHNLGAPAFPASSAAVSRRCGPLSPNAPRGRRPDFSFPVTTLGNRGKCRGTLEVSESEILLHRSRQPAVTWPLHFLRRYGHEPGIFSFESGRRCESGPGIFTFHSAQAEEIFHLVQHHIQNSASAQFSGALPPLIFERGTVPSNSRYIDNTSRLPRPRINSLHSRDSAGDGDYLRPNSLRRELRHHSAGEAFLGANAAFHPRVSAAATTSSAIVSVSDTEEHALVDLSPPATNAAQPPQPRSQRPQSLNLPTSPSATDSARSISPDNVFPSPREEQEISNYMNVGLDERPPPATIGHRHCVSEMGTAASGRGLPYVNLSEASVRAGEAAAAVEETRASLDYVMLNVGSERRRPGAEAPARHSNYALIDTAKTRALKFFSRDLQAAPRSLRSRHDSAFT